MEQTERSLNTRDLASQDAASPDAERTPAATGESGSQSSGRVTPAPAPTAGSAASASASDRESDEGGNGSGTLLSTELSADFRSSWESIQTQFVDQPRGAVEDADRLVATVMQRLAEGFAQERERLESVWDRGEDISTEDLRVALRRYRSFFQRLLSA